MSDAVEGLRALNSALRNVLNGAQRLNGLNALNVIED
jgi:hypothetical protein